MLKIFSKAAARLFYPAVFLLALTCAFLSWQIARNRPAGTPPLADSQATGAQEEPARPAEAKPKNPAPAPLPESLLLPAPFTPQAPTANWDELHNEACEEAAIIMAAQYFASSTQAILETGLVEKELARLTEWQQRTFGYNLSITAEETALMAEETYELKTQIITDISRDSLKNALARGKLLVFPANGRLLKNPNYKLPGPIYHMLVIKGYDSDGKFITNDPGTRKGLDYRYDFEVLHAANGSYSHETKAVDTAKKTAILVWRE